jgi:hypothetical protein
MPWPKVPASTVSLMDAPCPHTHTTNEQPLRERPAVRPKPSKGRIVQGTLEPALDIRKLQDYVREHDE